MRQTYKKKYNLIDYYNVILLSIRAMFTLIGNRIKPKIDAKFVERLMLAVTEVNGCDVCSYVHTQMALKGGFTQEEIDSFLSASNAYIKPSEAKAILFAQHYADSFGKPEYQAYQALLDEYGKKKAKVILSAIQMMMLGNVAGIPMSAFLARMKGKRYQGSSIFYEIGMQLSILILFPIALLHTIINLITFQKNIHFSKKNI